MVENLRVFVWSGVLPNRRGKHPFFERIKNMKKTAKFSAIALLLGLAIGGSALANESLQNSKDAVTQTIIAEPTHHKHVTVPFDYLKHNSKYNLVYGQGGGSTGGMADRTVQCSKRGTMTAADCQRHCR